MTTNVYDVAKGHIATDSRWSTRVGRYVIFVDDTNFDKVEIVGDYSFMFAGSGRQIQAWKNWLRVVPFDFQNQPSEDGITLSGIDMNTNQVDFSQGESIRRPDSIFAGSGATYARACWDENKDAIKSVNTAKIYDERSGGNVKYVEFNGRKHNLGSENIFAPSTIDGVNQLLNSEGIIMDIANKTYPLSEVPFRVSDLAASGTLTPDLVELKNTLESKTLSAEAPCDSMYSTWSDESKERLKTFLTKVNDSLK